MNVRNEVRSHLVCEGVTMQDVLGKLEQQYGWSRSISNLSGKLHRETLRYKEAVELEISTRLNSSHSQQSRMPSSA